MTVTLSDAQIAVLRDFLEYSDVDNSGHKVLNNYSVGGCRIDYAYAKLHLSHDLTEVEWDQLCALFPSSVEIIWRRSAIDL